MISLDSGMPLTFTASGTTYNSSGNAVVADQVAPFHKPKGISVGVNWFDPTAFAQPTGVRNGNTGQNIYSGPAQFHFDANVTRNFGNRTRYAAISAERVSSDQYPNPQ